MSGLRFIAMMSGLFLGACAASAQLVPSNVGTPSSGLPPLLQNVGFEPALNAKLPLDLPFTDETGRSVQLKEYFTNRPVVLALVYYGCPMLCDQLQEGLVGSLRMLSFTPGKDYQVVFVSFDPRDTLTIAAQKKAEAVKQFHRPETADGWHFLTGTPDSIRALTQAANFRYSFDQKSGLFAHASGIMLLTPDGRISRYFYGVEYPSREIRLGLVDASAGKIGTVVDHVLLYCFQYDPSTAKYSASILKILRLGGVLTIVCIVAGILIFRRREVEAEQSPSRGAR
ncbi:MAG TPA: SCO family protein [Candidatus Acidoferrum sp.]|nr:SCO family protein [Candidatus Acidoferrum sp.]